MGRGDNKNDDDLLATAAALGQAANDGDEDALAEIIDNM